MMGVATAGECGAGQGCWKQVTVILVNYNGSRYLRRCLQALMHQHLQAGEILLVDNASTDNSLEIVREFPQVRVLSQAVNLGFSAANNLAVRAVSVATRWIALLNIDAFVAPGWLEALFSAVERHPECAAFSSLLLNAANPEVLDGVGDACHVSGRVWRQGYGRPLEAATLREVEVFSPCAAAALYNLRAFESVGGFDEDFFCFVEDVDLGFRLRLAGYACCLVPSAVVYHVGAGSSGGRHSDFAVFYGQRNLVWLYLKNMPGLLFWLFLPLFLVVQGAAILRCWQRGQGRLAMAAKRAAFAGLLPMWQKRQLIQSKRVASLWLIFSMLKKT